MPTATSSHTATPPLRAAATTAPPYDYLLATWDGGGHAGPMLSVAAALLARGHRVRVLADPVLRPEVEASGAEFVAWRRAPHRVAAAERAEVVFGDWKARTPAQAAALARDGLICGPAGLFAEDCRAELRRRPADAVVADHMLPGVLIGAEAEDVRTVSLATSLLFVPEWGVPAMGLGLRPGGGPLNRLRAAALARFATRMWREGLPALNAACAANGIDPVGEPVELLSRWDRVLVLSSRALEFPEFSPPDHVRLVGARLDDPSWAAPWSSPPGNDPLVLVALSSTFMDQAGVLDRAAAALDGLPVRGLVTTGPAIDPATVTAPANVTVVRSAPHARVLRHAAAVVTHAGHGTVAKALAAGVPLVALPLGRDQRDIAARVEACGAGLALRSDAEPARIGSAVRRVLSEASFGVAARRAARVMAAEAAHDRAVAELEALVRTS